MKPNIGTKDRIVSLEIGVVLVSLALINKSTFMALGGLFSIFEAFSSWVRILYSLAEHPRLNRGMNTRESEYILASTGSICSLM